MSLRKLMILVLALMAVPALCAQADDVEQPQVTNSKNQVQGVINASAVQVRSGPGEGYYATASLDKGASIVVVGMKFDWLKIVPPDGSYSYIGTIFVNLSADGTTGTVNRPDVNVRAGSDLNPMKTTVQMRLGNGDTVQVIGKQDEYLKIKPPAGAYLYIKKQYVDVVGRINVAPDQGAIPLASDPVVHTATPTAPAAATAVSIDAGAPATTQPSTAIAAATATTAVTTPATTQPSVVVAPAPPTAEELYAKFETEYTDLCKQPLADQKIDPVLADYQSIAKADGLSDTLKQVVQLRVAILQARQENQTRLIAEQKLEAQAAQQQLALQQERTELQDQEKKVQVDFYAAVGTLQPSSLQIGGATLYRLTDPATGRTVVYLRSDDTRLTNLIGQFIGVRGDLGADAQLPLKVVTPTDIETVDPNKVNSTVTAEIIPPSFLARPAAAQSTP